MAEDVSKVVGHEKCPQDNVDKQTLGVLVSQQPTVSSIGCKNFIPKLEAVVVTSALDDM